MAIDPNVYFGQQLHTSFSNNSKVQQQNSLAAFSKTTKWILILQHKFFLKKHNGVIAGDLIYAGQVLSFGGFSDYYY